MSGVRAYVKDFAALVRVVQHAHGLGIFHRDISISNIFYDKQSNEKFLNDWSSAHKRFYSAAASPFSSQEDSVKWVGTPYFSCSRVDGQGNHIPTAANDLFSIVKCAQLSYCNQLAGDGEIEILRSRDLAGFLLEDGLGLRGEMRE